MTYLTESGAAEEAVFRVMVDQSLTKILSPLIGLGGTNTNQKIADKLVVVGNYTNALNALVKKFRYVDGLNAGSTDADVDAGVTDTESINLLKQLLGVT